MKKSQAAPSQQPANTSQETKRAKMLIEFLGSVKKPEQLLTFSEQLKIAISSLPINLNLIKEFAEGKLLVSDIESLINNELTEELKQNLELAQEALQLKYNDALFSMLLRNNYDIKSSQAEALILQLIQKGADINAQRADKSTPILLAAKQGYVSVVKALIDGGANMDKPFEDGTPLTLAVENGHIRVVEMLIGNGADVNAAKQKGLTPLILAAKNGLIDIARFLLEQKANVNLASEDGITPLFIAAQNNYLNLVKLFIKQKADVHAKYRGLATPLFIAAQQGHLDVVMELLANGSDINFSKENISTPLFIAAQKGHLNVVKFLIQKGANVNLAIKDGATPLYIALKFGHIEVANELIEAGADLSLGVGRDNILTPLLSAIRKQNLWLVFLLESKTPTYSDIQHFYIADHLFADWFYNLELEAISETTRKKGKKSSTTQKVYGKNAANQFLIRTLANNENKKEIFDNLISSFTINNLTDFVLSEEGKQFQDCLGSLLEKATMFGNEFLVNKIKAAQKRLKLPEKSSVVKTKKDEEPKPNKDKDEDKSQETKLDAIVDEAKDQQDLKQEIVLQTDSTQPQKPTNNATAEDIEALKSLFVAIFDCFGDKELDNIQIIDLQNFASYFHDQLARANKPFLSSDAPKQEDIEESRKSIAELKLQIAVYFKNELQKINQLGEKVPQDLVELCNIICSEVLNNIWRIESIEEQINSLDNKSPSSSPLSAEEGQKLTDKTLEAINKALENALNESTLKSVKPHGAALEKRYNLKADSTTKNRTLITSQFDTRIEDIREKLGDLPANITQEIVDNVVGEVAKKVKFSKGVRGGSHSLQCDDMPKIFPSKRQKVSGEEKAKYMGFWQELSRQLSSKEIERG